MVDRGLSRDHVHPRRLLLYRDLRSRLAKFRTSGAYLLADAIRLPRLTVALPFWASTMFGCFGTSRLFLRDQFRDRFEGSTPGRALCPSLRSSENRGRGDPQRE